MIIRQEDFIGKVRTAIDDIAPAVADSFVGDVNAELWQAAAHAATELSVELPINLLDVTMHTGKGTIDLERGCAYMVLPDGYLRFVGFDVTGWEGMLHELIEPGSDAEKMQRSRWSRGTASKPKAMLSQDNNGKKTIVWWPGGEHYDDGKLVYVAMPEVYKPDADATGVVAKPDADATGMTAEGPDGETTGMTAEGPDGETSGTTTGTGEIISCAIRTEAEHLLVYRTASLFFEGKKEDAIAEKFRTLSTNY